MKKHNKIQQLKSEIQNLEKELSQKQTELKQLLNSTESCNLMIDNNSSPEDKVKLFRSLFKGRDDVYAVRFESKKTGRSGYQPSCNNEWVPGICQKPKIKCKNCNNKDYRPITNNEITFHLKGEIDKGKDFIMGLYPLLKDETCFFLAIDFDKENWKQDSKSFITTCQNENIPAYLERSRSGNGGHIWIFFEERVKASLARKLGSILMTKTLDIRPEIGLESFDRFFPNQDTMPKGGFGNLIALPPVLRNRILRLASFSNPEFYKAQAMRLQTWNKPRILYLYEQFPNHIALPIGCIYDLKALLNHYNIEILLLDKREMGKSVDLSFKGELRDIQHWDIIDLLPKK